MSTLESRRIGIIGYGKVGQALAWNFIDSGISVTAVTNAEHSKIHNDLIPRNCTYKQTSQQLVEFCDLVFLTVPDQEIQNVCESLYWDSRHIVIHCSGTQDTEVLNHAMDNGALTGVFHPLQTINLVKHPNDHLGLFTDVTFSITTESSVVQAVLSQVASTLDGFWVNLDKHSKIPYHIGAIMACGHVTTLLELSKQLMTTAGLDHIQSSSALKTIVETTIDNYFTYGSSSLTGPVVRHDKDTVLSHIDWLREHFPQALELYTTVTQQASSIMNKMTDPTPLPDKEIM
tara:strand:+ start:6562 stop:7425 length:864 start_codon:yes stop_codon:yes gene_type:complete